MLIRHRCRLSVLRDCAASLLPRQPLQVILSGKTSQTAGKTNSQGIRVTLLSSCRDRIHDCQNYEQTAFVYANSSKGRLTRKID
jgi:hypothetical protein